jgi:hypothetical protein
MGLAFLIGNYSPVFSNMIAELGKVFNGKIIIEVDLKCCHCAGQGIATGGQPNQAQEGMI